MPDEKTHADALRFYLTGAGSDGGAQADPDAALGDYRSSTLCEFLAITVTNPISNVTVDFAAGLNGTGDGTLTATGNDTLAWTAPGGSQGANVTILNGETKILEDGTTASKFVRVTRTTADNLTGTATCTLADTYNDVVGLDNVSSAEAAAGDDEYRAVMLKNESASDITVLKLYLQTLGTQRTSDSGQLGASGAGTISISSGNFNDWPDYGWCRIVTSGGSEREIVYYTSCTATALTVPAAGRERLGTSAAAGAATDTVDAVPGIRIAKELPVASAIQTIADEDTAPTGLTWRTGNGASDGPVDIGTLSAGALYGLWIHREIPAGAVAVPDALNHIAYQFDTAA